jgi:hypothetical protein
MLLTFSLDIKGHDLSGVLDIDPNGIWTVLEMRFDGIVLTSIERDFVCELYWQEIQWIAESCLD